MPEVWIALTGFIMLILFWRQLTIFKLDKKINYAPVVLIIGFISSICMFVFSKGELQHDLKYALMPLLIALIFYMVMYLMFQVKITSDKVEKEKHERLLAILISNIKEYFGVLDGKLSAIESTEEQTLQAMQLALKNELSEFSEVFNRQAIISQKLEDMYKQQEEGLSAIESFLRKDVVDFDAVIHRHIDVLRIAEQDHYHKLQSALNTMKDNLNDSSMQEAIRVLSTQLDEIEESFKDSAFAVANEAKEKIDSMIKSMNEGLLNTKQLSESVMLSTQEYEAKLQELHKQAGALLQKSDTIHESMEDTFEQSQKIRPVYSSLNELISRLMDIYAEYKHAKKELHIVASELGNAEERHFEIMDKKIDALTEEIHMKMDASMRELKDHYHIADKDVTSTVKTLAAKAQLQKSYGEE